MKTTDIEKLKQENNALKKKLFACEKKLFCLEQKLFKVEKQKFKLEVEFLELKKKKDGVTITDILADFAARTKKKV